MQKASKVKCLMVRLGMGACVLVASACPAPKKPEPSGEYMKVRPQRIAVVAAEPAGGDEFEERMAELIREELRAAGFDSSRTAPVDAELCFRVDERRAIRGREDGRKMVEIFVSAVLVSDTVVLWKGDSRGIDCDARLDKRGIAVAPDLRGESMAPTDPAFRTLMEVAASRAAYGLINDFPDRVAVREEGMP